MPRNQNTSREQVKRRPAMNISWYGNPKSWPRRSNRENQEHLSYMVEQLIIREVEGICQFMPGSDSDFEVHNLRPALREFFTGTTYDDECSCRFQLSWPYGKDALVVKMFDVNAIPSQPTWNKPRKCLTIRKDGFCSVVHAYLVASSGKKSHTYIYNKVKLEN